MKNILQGGFAANYSEASVEELNKEYGMYLMDGEQITMGFKLVRDALIFTDKRIVLTDKQGATGTKNECYIHKSVFHCWSKDGDIRFGFDDSELTFTYINSPELKGHHVTYASHKLEFPKKYNVQSLYKILQELAYENCLRINGLDK